VFTGTSDNTTTYITILIAITSDVGSAANGIECQNSFDNSTWTTFSTNTYTNIGVTQTFTVQSTTPYFRIRYTNGNTSTTSFELNVFLDDVNRLNASNATVDAFSRQRVSNPLTLMDIKSVRDYRDGDGNSVHPLVAEYKTANTTITHVPYQSLYELTVSANNAKVVRQSRRYLVYQPGKSLLIMMSGVLTNIANNNDVTSRIGYFDDYNGVFFQHDENGTSVVLRYQINSSGGVGLTGAFYENKVYIQNWNMNNLSSKDGISFDPTKAHVFVFDLEWLGVGSVRCGLVLDGVMTYVHQFNHPNTLNRTYMKSANLPLRYEILSTGGTGTMKMVCCTAISEGGYSPAGIPRSLAVDIGNITTTSEISVITFRLLPNFIRTTLKMLSMSFISTTNAAFMTITAKLVRAVDVTSQGYTWISAPGFNPSFEYTLNTSVWANLAPDEKNKAVEIFNRFVYGRTDVGPSDLAHSFGDFLSLTANYEGVPDLLVITCVKPGSNANLYISADMLEIE
jgi:hypothetical protein